MTVYRPFRNQKNRHCSQDAFSGYFYLGDWIINRKKKKPDNGPKNGPKENKGKLEESKSPLLKKSKVLNELAWGHCEKRYNTWSCPIAVSRPCRNQKNRHFPQDAFSGYFYLGDWIIDRKKNKNSVIFCWSGSEMGQRTGQKKNRENVRKKNHQFSKIKGIEWLAWGHCEKSYNTWPFPMAVFRPCRNQIIRHCPQDAFFEHFYLRDWFIDRKKKRAFWLMRGWYGLNTG